MDLSGPETRETGRHLKMIRIFKQTLMNFFEQTLIEVLSTRPCMKKFCRTLLENFQTRL